MKKVFTFVFAVVLLATTGGVALAQASPVEVEKEWTYTDVCWEVDNDLDGKYFEIDDPGDPWECIPEGEEEPVYSLGTQLPHEGDVHFLEATVKNDKIKNINPGQFYAVSTVTVIEDLEYFEINELYSEVIGEGIGELKPNKGGAKVVVVKMLSEIPIQIYDAMDDDVVEVGGGKAEVTLGPVSAGEVYKIYVKFQPTLKGEDMGEYWAENWNCAYAYDGEVGEEICDSAIITVIEKGAEDEE